MYSYALAAAVHLMLTTSSLKLEGHQHLVNTEQKRHSGLTLVRTGTSKEIANRLPTLQIVTVPQPGYPNIQRLIRDLSIMVGKRARIGSNTVVVDRIFSTFCKEYPIAVRIMPRASISKPSWNSDILIHRQDVTMNKVYTKLSMILPQSSEDLSKE